MLEYFSGVAAGWRKYRKARSYYWDQITSSMGFYIHPESSVLEIGCATGETIAQLPGRRKVGIDFCPELIEQAREAHPDVEFHVMDAEDIQLDEQFDVVVMSNLVGFLGDIENVLRQVRKVCHAKTRLIITTYNRLGEPMISFAEAIGIKRRSPEQNWISVADMKNLLYLAGFETYMTYGSMLIPYRVPLLAWLLNKWFSNTLLAQGLDMNKFFYARPVPVEEGWEKRYSVSVVIPARNESGNIRAALERTPEMGSHTEIIFVEGNSTDDTWETILKEPAGS